jgi:SAM-dependent methyltransferase
MPSFDARGYWNNRLTSRWTVGGTGHMQYSPGYNRWLYRAKRHALRAVLRGVTPGRAVDVGSGIGWVVRQLLDGGWSVSGCDIAPVAVERLRSELPDVPFHLVDVGTDPLPVADRSTDLATALDVAYHVVDADAFEHFLGEVARALKPTGLFVVSDCFGASDVIPAEHVRFRSGETWRGAAARAGLRVDELRPYFRWLSRPPEASRLRHIPESARGAVEYAVDRLVPLPPWMRLAVLRPSG